jgi:hypothetical protein
MPQINKIATSMIRATPLTMLGDRLWPDVSADRLTLLALTVSSTSTLMTAQPFATDFLGSPVSHTRLTIVAFCPSGRRAASLVSALAVRPAIPLHAHEIAAQLPS